MEGTTIRFGHEKLEVYKRAIQFVVWLDGIISKAERNRNVIDQIDRASISVVLNIAEGNGKSSKKDQNRFIEIARGSSLECAACLDIMLAKRMIQPGKADEGKEQLEIIAKMLFKLGQSLLGSVNENPSPKLSLSLSHD